MSTFSPVRWRPANGVCVCVFEFGHFWRWGRWQVFFLIISSIFKARHCSTRVISDLFCFVCSLTCQKHKVKAIHYTINSIGFHVNNSKWPPNKFVKKLTTLCLWILFLLYFVLRDYWRGHYWHLTGTVIFCLRCLNMDGAYILILYSMPSS